MEYLFWIGVFAASYLLSEKDRDIFQDLASKRTRGVSKDRYRRRRTGGRGGHGIGLGVQNVAIKAGVFEAAYNALENYLTPTVTTLPKAYKDSEGRWTFDLSDDPSNTLDVENWFGTPVEISAGKWRVGKVIAGELMNVDCAEFDLPTGNESGAS